MICPVCEHAQDFGLECEVCGKDLSELGGLAGLGPPPAAVTRVEGLEVTVADRVGEVPVERVGALEETRFGDVAVPVERLAEVEVPPQVGAVPVEPLIDLSDDRAPDDGARTAAPTGAVTCRYCRNVQATGAICDRCGMRLPRVAGAPPAAKVASSREPVHVRCRTCGAPAEVGERCSECGRLVPRPDE